MTDTIVEFTGLHEGQRVVASSKARFGVLCAGRRFGKTTLAVTLALSRAVAGQRVWWVAPTYKLGNVGWRLMREWAGRIPGSEMRVVEKRFEFPGGGFLEVRTAGAPGLLRGEGLDFVVFDECAQAPEESWTAELRPSLSDRKGGALFISTPRGRANWFHGLYQHAMRTDTDEWQAWKFPSVSNPRMEPEEIQLAKDSLPAQVFDQEYMAEFLDAGTVVFRAEDVQLVRDRATGLADPVRGRQYLTAWDIGRRGDPTVGITIDWTQTPYQVVAYERMSKIPYPEQQRRIEARAAKYPGRTIVESNGPGDPVIENMVDTVVEPWVTTARSKVQGIQALQLWLEHGGLGCTEPQVLTELEGYEWVDRDIQQDCVMALAIAAASLPAPGRAQRLVIQVGQRQPSMSGGTDWQL